jgi:hypothetical protein
MKKKRLWLLIAAFLLLTLAAAACGILALHMYRQEEYLASSLFAGGGLAIKIIMPFVLIIILRTVRRLLRKRKNLPP